MESSAPKRRKTSPTSSVAIDANKSTTPTDSPPSSRTRRSIRPSFASPTKASLARHNPDILSRRQPAASTSAQDAEPSASRPGSPDGDGDDVERALSAQLERLSEPDVAEPGDGSIEASQEASGTSNRRLSAPARRISANFAKSPARKVGGGLAAKPRRSSIKPSPRPLPPPGPEDEEDILNPFVGRGLHRSPAGVIPEVVQEEPELPPTPEHPDPVVSTPPSGIHNTPSKRPRRSKSLADKIRSSPSKPTPSKLRPRIVRRGSPEPIRDMPSTLAMAKSSTRKKDIRGLEKSGPDPEKELRRNRLRSQIAQLEEDLQVLSSENKRMENITTVTFPIYQDDLLRIVGEHVMPRKPQKPNQTTAFLDAALNPIPFLPFGKASSSLPSLFHQDSKEQDEDVSTLISHHPIQMDIKNELPYLEVFTPLSFTSKIHLIQEESSAGAALHRHVITAKSNPPGFFTTRLEMTVNTKTLAITDMSVPRVEPAAVTELIPFIDNILGQGNSNSALMKNVSIITWALGEWYRVAMQRAQFWIDLKDELGSKDAITHSVHSMRTRKPTRRRRRHQNTEDSEHEDEDSAPSARKRQRPKTEVLSQLGQLSTNLVIPMLGSSEEVMSDLRVEWHIEFDWTGEARSKIGVQVGVPAKWHQGDERKRLAGIPDLFNKMLHGGEDPLVAVKIVVSLLAGDASA